MKTPEEALAQCPAEPAQEDQRTPSEAMPARCPVAHDNMRGWLVYSHREVRRIVEDHETFSNRVSRHLSVPNGMDPPEHGTYRALIERYLTPSRIDALESPLRAIAAGLSATAATGEPVEIMTAYAGPFAAKAQCASLGWPDDLDEVLQAWVRRNRDATRRGDREQLAELAREFALQVAALLAERRNGGAPPDADITTELLHERVQGNPLGTDEIVSILRNWTVGEVGTIAASVGIVAHFLAQNPVLQAELRADAQAIPAAIDEILRLDGPLVANRRRATYPTDIAGQRIEPEDRVEVIWTAANRDPDVFEQPQEFRWERDPADNLLYGSGIHVCPGAPLARLELRVMLEELLRATTAIEMVSDDTPQRATWPDAGFDRLPLRLRPR